ncbi:LuxR C-terminal-related transcriptional regulator [Pseudomonas fontis]|uniref:LuxR C-terminal-related transcriptional regulator n=1 Tax=Pseudomonas fontis TaxID=2942633 RepID=UPI003B680726
MDRTLSKKQEFSLREREKEMVRWPAEGRTSEEISLILGVTIGTVNFHLRNVQKSWELAIGFKQQCMPLCKVMRGEHL